MREQDLLLAREEADALRQQHGSRAEGTRHLLEAKQQEVVQLQAELERREAECGHLKQVLAEGQRVASAKLGLAEGSKPFDFVFHGGSGSLKSEIEDSLRYGVVKMNVDTDTQYAFTRPIAGHMFTNYDGVLKVDGEVGNKKVYDPRVYMKKAEAGMTERVIEACNDLRSKGRSVSAG